MNKILKIIVSSIILIFTIIFIQNSQYGLSAPMQDLFYKIAIIKESQNPDYKLENLRPLVGERELTKFIRQNDNNPDIYTPNDFNIQNGIFRANLHMHTTNSDGQSTVQDFFDLAQNYAEEHIKNNEYMYIAITDHNTVLGAQEVIKVLQENPNKYTRIKVIAGIEINTIFHDGQFAKEPIHIHLLTWCINPYDEFLNREFYKADLNDKWNMKRPIRDFVWTVKTMSKYGIPGVAHPARYTMHLGKDKYPYINEMLTAYKKITRKQPFTEAYYQSYNDDIKLDSDYIDYIDFKANQLKISRTGSTDAHGRTIFMLR